MRFLNDSPPVIKNIVIINAIILVAQYLFDGPTLEGDFFSKFALHWTGSSEFRPWQVVTHMFMHGGILHFLFNMLALYMLGSILERLWGSQRFLFVYLASGIVAALAQLAAYYFVFTKPENMQLLPLADSTGAVGASGAVMGIAAAFAYLFPNTPMYIIPIPIPIKAKWLILGYFIFDLTSGIINAAGDNVAHFAHVGGAITGFLITYYWNKNKRTFY